MSLNSLPVLAGFRAFGEFLPQIFNHSTPLPAAVLVMLRSERYNQKTHTVHAAINPHGLPELCDARPVI
jgi:hypothetical protein